jgi:hypothetical protein
MCHIKNMMYRNIKHVWVSYFQDWIVKEKFLISIQMLFFHSWTSKIFWWLFMLCTSHSCQKGFSLSGRWVPSPPFKGYRSTGWCLEFECCLCIKMSLIYFIYSYSTFILKITSCAVVLYNSRKWDTLIRVSGSEVMCCRKIAQSTIKVMK